MKTLYKIHRKKITILYFNHLKKEEKKSEKGTSYKQKNIIHPKISSRSTPNL